MPQAISLCTPQLSYKVSLHSIYLSLLSGLLLLQVSCSSSDFDDEFSSSSAGSQIIDHGDGYASCAVDDTPLITTTAYRIASLKPMKQDAQFKQLSKKYPNYLPSEWSLTSSSLYRYPGPVQYCPTCQTGMEQALKLAYEEGELNYGTDSPSSDNSQEQANSRIFRSAPIAGMGGVMSNF